MFHLSPARIRLYVGGNRSGKTTSGFVELLWHLTGEYPSWYPVRLRFNRPIKARWACPDFEKGVGEILQEKIDEYMPWEYVTNTHKNSRGYVVKYFFRNGSTLDVVTYEQDLLTFEGVSRDYVHFDEPPRRDKFVASLRATVDRGGRISMSLTPISEPWIYDELYLAEDLDVEVITTSIYENPHLSREYIKEFEKMLTPEEKLARIEGKFLNIMGLVYKQLNRAVHGVERFEVPPEWLRWFVIDPHDRKPHYLGWFAVDSTGDCYWYRAMKVEGTISEVVEKVKEVEEKTGDKIYRRLIDPNFGQKIYGNSKLTVKEEFEKAARERDFDFRLDLANDNIEAGHLKVKEYLRYDPNKPISLTNKPKLFIFNDLYDVWHDLQRYVYDEWKANRLEKSAKEKPKDLYKDYPDVLRYFLMDNPTYIEPEIVSRRVAYA